MAVRKQERSVTSTEMVYTLDVEGGSAEARVANGVATVFIQTAEGARSDLFVELAHVPILMQLVQAMK